VTGTPATRLGPARRTRTLGRLAAALDEEPARLTPP
jgi:hypothetical protein